MNLGPFIFLQGNGCHSQSCLCKCHTLPPNYEDTCGFSTQQKRLQITIVENVTHLKCDATLGSVEQNQNSIQHMISITKS